MPGKMKDSYSSTCMYTSSSTHTSRSKSTSTSTCARICTRVHVHVRVRAFCHECVHTGRYVHIYTDMFFCPSCSPHRPVNGPKPLIQVAEDVTGARNLTAAHLHDDLEVTRPPTSRVLPKHSLGSYLYFYLGPNLCPYTHIYFYVYVYMYDVYVSKKRRCIVRTVSNFGPCLSHYCGRGNRDSEGLLCWSSIYLRTENPTIDLQGCPKLKSASSPNFSPRDHPGLHELAVRFRYSSEAPLLVVTTTLEASDFLKPRLQPSFSYSIHIYVYMYVHVHARCGGPIESQLSDVPYSQYTHGIRYLKYIST